MQEFYANDAGENKSAAALNTQRSCCICAIGFDQVSWALCESPTSFLVM